MKKEKELTKKQVANFWKKYNLSKLTIKSSLIRTVTLTSCLLTGCATVQPVAPIDTINLPEASIMLHCGKKTPLEDGKFATAISKLVEYSQIIDECNKQNEAKIRYIETELKAKK